jgi:hypothetical protein
MFLAEKKVSSYAEIGIERGGFYYLVDSFLRWKRGPIKSIAVDIKDVTVNMGAYVEAYAGSQFVLLEKGQPSLPLTGYDLVFIDTNERRMAKYLRAYGPERCKYLAFDDTHDRRWGARKIKCDHDFWNGGRAPGIGVIDWSLRT